MPEFNIITRDELKQMFIDIDAPAEIQMYFTELTERYEKLKEVPSKQEGFDYCCDSQNLIEKETEYILHNGFLDNCCMWYCKNCNKVHKLYP